MVPVARMVRRGGVVSGRDAAALGELEGGVAGRRQAGAARTKAAASIAASVRLIVGMGTRNRDVRVVNIVEIIYSISTLAAAPLRVEGKIL